MLPLAQQTVEDWDNHIRSLIRYWKDDTKLGESQLTELLLVQKKQYAPALAAHPFRKAEALRQVVKESIALLAPAGEAAPPVSDVFDARWCQEPWRNYAILTLRLAGYTYEAVSSYVGSAGGNYGEEYKKARMMLAQIIRDREGSPTDTTPTIYLEYPSGAIKPEDSFYIERAVDKQIAPAVAFPGQTITIRGPRQVGKTSLLVRTCRKAVENLGAQVINFDLQEVGEEGRSSLETVLKTLSTQVFNTLNLDFDELDRIWSRSKYLTPQMNVIDSLEHALTQVGSPIVLAMDEVDVIQTKPFANDFFGLVRRWHNLHAQSPLWARLTIILVISTEPYLLIDRVGESPFNVGTKILMRDFSLSEVEELNGRYQSPVAPADVDQLYALLNGHPYLTRVALYTMVTGKQPWAELEKDATGEDGPFGQHLKWQYRLVSADERLRATLREVIETGRPGNEAVAERLKKAGLIVSDGDNYACRCDLYRRYFAGKRL